MAQYVTKQQLITAVRESQASGLMTAELVEYIKLIAVNYHKRYTFGNLDECIQNFYCCILRIMPRLNPEKNLFGYFTTCFSNECRQNYSMAGKYVKQIASIVEHEKSKLSSNELMQIKRRRKIVER